MAEELHAELARWPWAGAAWAAMGEDSRAAYERWVRSARTSGQARRRARTVLKRLWSGRPFAGPVRRRLQTLADLLDGPVGDAGMNMALGPPGWIP